MHRPHGRKHEPVDSTPHLPFAGRAVASDEGGARACVDPPSHDRPTTPPELQKYRRSFAERPGVTVRHYGRADDEVPDMRFGHTNVYNATAKEAVAPGLRPSIVEKMQELQEASYASHVKEPLGRTAVRGHTLPEEVHSEDFAFGKAVPVSESSKNVIYPEDSPADGSEEVLALYRRTHGSYAPGEQRQRGYDWSSAGVDPSAHRFGRTESNVIRDGVRQALKTDDPNTKETKIVSKLHGVTQNMKDELGKSKNLGFGTRGLSPDHSFGAPSSKHREWGVAECLRGNAQEDASAEDPTLGRSTRPGYRNVGPESRIFGVPTIRTDVPAPKHRSVADVSNYGGEPNAKGVIQPSRYAHINVMEEDFVQPLPKEELWEILSAAGLVDSRDDFEHIFALAADEFGGPSAVSVQAFRQVRFAVKEA